MKIIKYLAILSILLAITFYTVFFGLTLVNRNNSQLDLIIPSGSAFYSVAQNLEDSGLIYSKYLFIAYGFALGDWREIKSGTYRIDKAISVSDLFRLLVLGSHSETRVTIPEGANINDIDKILTSEGYIKSGEFLKVNLLKYEGFFFPDTYDFERGSSPERIASVMIANFYKKVLDRDVNSADFIELINRGADLDIVDSYRELVVKASMLEKEVRSEVDMKHVAGIIENRLSDGMALQIDATTAYGECYEQFRRSLNCETSKIPIRANIDNKNSFNTYVIVGLPSAPISNPGLKAINSAKSPTTTKDYYYFTDSRGDVFYSKTFDEHLSKLKNLK